MDMTGVFAQQELSSAVSGGDVGIAGDAALAALRRTAVELADLVVDAAELDERVDALARREHELSEKEREFESARRLYVDAAEALARRERELMAERDELQAGQGVLDQARRAVEAREREVEAKAGRLHWRWLLRAWRWRPAPAGRALRMCELLLVPTPAGYVLLEQSGVALKVGSTLSVLIDAETRFVVTKIAPWHLDSRWCAYLQQASQPTEEGGDGDE
jgi:hypothetical protein